LNSYIWKTPVKNAKLCPALLYMANRQASKHTHIYPPSESERTRAQGEQTLVWQGGEALLRNSIITFSSLARRLEAQTVAVQSSGPPPSAALGSSLCPGLCLLHRT